MFSTRRMIVWDQNITMGGRLLAVAGMPANRAFLECPAGQSDLPKKCSYRQNRIGNLLPGNPLQSDVMA